MVTNPIYPPFFPLNTHVYYTFSTSILFIFFFGYYLSNYVIYNRILLFELDFYMIQKYPH